MKERGQLNFGRRWRVKLKAPRRAAAKRSKRIGLGIIGGLVCIAVVSWPWLYGYALTRELAALERQIVSVQDIDSQVYQIQELESLVDAQERFLGLITEARKNPSEVLNRLQQQLPTGSTLVSFSMAEDNSFKASITFPSPVDAANFWSGMMSSNYFETKDIATMSLEDKEQTLNMEFKLK